MDIKYFEIFITLFFAVISWVVTRQIKRIDVVENENKEIKDNYLERFERITEKLNEIHTDVAVIKNNCELKTKCDL